MSMMLSEGDIAFMKESVRDVIEQWHTTITIRQPLPLEQQPNYNKLMHEFVDGGEIMYEDIVISAERKDIVNNYTNNLPPDDTEYGEKNAGTILYAIPSVLPVFKDGQQIGVRAFKPHKESVIIVDNSSDRYYIQSIRDRIGETLITIKRYTGAVPEGSIEIDNDKVPTNGLADIEHHFDESEENVTITVDEESDT